MRSRAALIAAAALLGLAAPLAAQVDFARQVHPILVKRCFACHSASVRQGGLSVEKLEHLIEGGAGGAAVVPGAASDSPLYRRAAGLDEPRMPLGSPPLADAEVAILRDWIDQGARWDGAGEGPLRSTAPLAPRRPALPEGEESNPIDRFLAYYRAEQGFLPLAPVPDAVFLRRAYLDVWGFVPPPEALAAFESDPDPSKRGRLVDALLGDSGRYAEHWISFWNDLLRNDEGVIYHGGRESITDWLLAALAGNLPYDRMVRDLLSPDEGEGAPEGFLIGVNWRGTVNASQTPAMQAAQNSAQVFLGINLKCASCHDSFVNQWKLADAYGLAAYFSEEPLELVRCDTPTGRRAEARFLFPELGGAAAPAALAERRVEVARLVTAPDNGRFARAIVNRYWKRLMGRGFIEPADDLDEAPWNADLLDWLAADFADHGYDLKRLVRAILTSDAYQAPAVSRAGEPYVFRGPLERRLSAEQFADSVSALTGEWPAREIGKRAEYARDWRLKATPLGRALGRPVRDQVFTERNELASTLQAIELLNGETLTRRLREGARRLLGRRTEAPRPLFDSGYLRRDPAVEEFDLRGAERLWLVVVDGDSYDPARVAAGWRGTVLIGPQGEVPLETLLGETPVGAIPSERVVDLAGRSFTRMRATAEIDASSRASDINPRVRFFVFAERPEPGRYVEPGGASPIGMQAARLPAEPRAAVERLYLHALARRPSNEETAVALELLRPSADGAIPSEGLEDLLWSLVLLPEFQTVR